jgi:predicted O-methyltransferase YrrM
MYPNSLLQEIYDTEQVTDGLGNKRKLTYHIDVREGGLLHSLIDRYGFSKSVEIGCAFGISSLWICSGLSKQPNAHHTIIDPFQEAGFDGVASSNLKIAGFDFYDLIRKPSELALPQMVEEGKIFQFALIDGCHTFDHVLLDFYYVNQLLEVGGIVVFDDVSWAPIRRVVRYILGYPNYSFVSGVPIGKCSFRKGLFNAYCRFMAAVLPKPLSDTYYSAACSMVALQKTGPDTRPDYWYKRF